MRIPFCFTDLNSLVNHEKDSHFSYIFEILDKHNIHNHDAYSMTMGSFRLFGSRHKKEICVEFLGSASSAHIFGYCLKKTTRNNSSFITALYFSEQKSKYPDTDFEPEIIQFKEWYEQIDKYLIQKEINKFNLKQKIEKL